MTDYLFGVDFDQDGFVCLTCGENDPLNVLPTPLTHDNLPYAAFTSGTPARLSAALINGTGSPYGQWVYRFSTSTSGVGIWFGGEAGLPPTRIQVVPGQTYRITFWARNIYGGTRPLVVNPLDFTNTAWETLVGQITAAWQKFSFEITVPGGTPYMSIGIRAGMNANYEVYIMGLMLTEGADEPDGFNVGHASNRGDAVRNVVSASWRWGFWDTEDSVAPPARLNLTMLATGQEWAFEDPTSPRYALYKRELITQAVAVRPDSIGGDIYYLQFTGFLKDVRVDSDLAFPRYTYLTAEDPMLRLLDTEYKPPLLTNVDTGAAIEEVFDRATIVFPYQKDYFQLDYSRLDQAPLFANVMTDIDEGATELAYAGDNLDNGRGVSAQQFIREMADAELGGFFYWDALRGVFAFRNRNFDGENEESPVELEWVADRPALRYAYGSQIINDVEVNYTTRALGDVGATVYEQTQPVAIAAGATRQFTARYRHPDDTARVSSAIDMIPPQPSLDYEAYDAATGGNDVTGSIGVSVTFNASSADIAVRNNSSATVYLRKMRLRGTPLLVSETQTARASNGNSIGEHGRQSRSYDLPALSTATVADDFARRIIDRFSNPRGQIEEVTIAASAYADNAPYSWTWGTKVELFDDSLQNMHTVYVVHGIAHRLDADGLDLLTLFLRPHFGGFFTLDLSKLDSADRLAL